MRFPNGHIPSQQNNIFRYASPHPPKLTPKSVCATLDGRFLIAIYATVPAKDCIYPLKSPDLDI